MTEILTNGQAVVLAIVEGITEYLPISSTGHMILASHFLGIVESEATKVFEISIQLGAILAMFIIYWRKFLDIEMLKKLFIAFLPMGILGLVLFKYVKMLLGSELVVVLSLLVGGVIIIWVEKKYKSTNL